MTRSAVRGPGLLLPVVAFLMAPALLISPLGVAGQVTPPVGEEEVTDSIRIKILERLERLARPVGYDSILYIQDSISLAEAAQGIRPARAGMDSVATALLGMPGYTLTEYEAASADFATVERILVLEAPENGRARVMREGLVIEADTSITLNERTGLIRTVGDATFTPPEGDPVDAAQMVYDLTQARGTAIDAETSLREAGANWIVRGDMPYAAQDSTFMSHAQFTSCEVDQPHYHFEANEIKVVGGNLLVARGVKLYFADVPVAWLPFFAQSLSQGRSSGLLTPRFSVNDIVRNSSGYRRRISNVGFYWAMSDYTDALVSLDWFSETFFSVTSSFRYRVSQKFLDGELNVRRFWRENGDREFAIDTRHSWEIDERTQLRISGRFVSNNDFLRENSFNPQELTQSIDSEAGLNRRFNWGTLSVSANRKEFLSDDRTVWLLPSANVSLSPMTFFKAPSSEAHFWNNMTWAGSGGFARNTLKLLQPTDTFLISQASTATKTGRVSSNLSLGRLTLSQSVNVTESQTLDVPEALLLLGDSADSADLLTGAPARDIAEAKLRWTSSLAYQRQLIGSTTLTPRVTVSGNMFRSDTVSVASSFVSAPSRVALSVTLKSDIYGFYPGIGSFETIRHKFSPAFDYSWSPESAPNELQRQVFGSRALQPKNTISVSLTQTIEAKRRTDDEEPFQDLVDDTASLGGLPPLDRSGAPGRVQQTPTVKLLALRTSVVRYDFVEADSLGTFLSGFETTRLSNQISSDYMRGLSISMEHDLFDDELEDGVLVSRRFAPHLSQMNFSFSLGSRSSIFRWLGLAGGARSAEDLPEEPEEVGPLEFVGPTDQSSIVPVSGRDREVRTERSSRSGGGWTANLNYSLQRPRDPDRDKSQMLSGTVRLQPTVNWSLSWRTAYDLEASAFNDHSIRLSRDLHRWEANFDFLQTANGNWTFRFEVSLIDNRDLKFDYRQRNLDLGLPSSQR